MFMYRCTLRVRPSRFSCKNAKRCGAPSLWARCLQPRASCANRSWMIIHERLAHEAEGCKRLALKAGAPQRLAFLQENLEGLARNTQRYMSLEEL